MNKPYKYFSRYAPAAQEIYENGYPNQETDPDYHKSFWELQFQRFYHGYEAKKGDWIPGSFYFHVNFVHGDVYNPKSNDTTVMQYPYDDLSHELFCKYDEWEKKHIGGIVMKGRRMHFSTTMTTLLLHRWGCYPGSRLGIGAWDQDDVDNIRNAVTVARTNLPLDLGFKAVDNGDMLEASSKVISSVGQQSEGTFSRMLFRCFGGKTTKVGAFRGPPIKIHLIDEIGKNPKLLQCIAASRECWSKGSLMYGLPILGGTADKMTNKSNDLSQLIDEPGIHGFEVFVVPRQRFYYPFYDLKTGIASKEKQEEAKAFIKAKQDKLYELENKQSYYADLQENPTCLNDMLMGDSGNAILPLAYVNHQIKIINDWDSAQNNIRRYNLHWKNNRFDPDNPQVELDTTAKDGEYHMFKMPQTKYKNLDIAGIDTYFKDKAPGSPSKGSMYVYRRENIFDSSMFGNGPVCEYVARYPLIEQFYDGCLKLMVAYDCMALSEHDSAFKLWMSKMGMLRYFKTRPKVFDNNWTQQSQEYMVVMSGSMKDNLTGLLQQYLPLYYENIPFLRLLEDLKNYGVRNTDLAMGFGISLIHNADMHKQPVIDISKPVEPKGEFFPKYRRNPKTGSLEPVYFPNSRVMDLTQPFKF